MAVYRIGTFRVGTFRVSSTTRIGDQKRDFEKSMAILRALAGVIEKRDLLKEYPELGIEVNGIPVSREGAGRRV